MLVLASLVALAPPLWVPLPEPWGPTRVLRATRSDLGGPALALDGDPSTLYRTPSVNPAEIVVELPKPKEVRAFRVLVADRSRVVIECAGSAEELATKSGGYRLLVDARTNDRGELVAELGQAARGRVFRLWTRRLEGDDYVHVFDWHPVRRAPAESLRIVRVPNRPEWQPSDRVASEGIVRVRAFASAQGAESDVTDRVRWSGVGFRRWRDGWQAKRVEEGSEKASLVATAGPLKATLELTVFAYPRLHRRTDVGVLHIERLPRMDYDAPDRGNGPGWPAEGERVVWRAWVVSHHRPARDVRYRWTVDGRTVAEGALNLVADRWVHADLTRRWRQSGETIRFEILPPEWDANPGNNAREFRSNALAVGFWVDRRIWDHFLEHQHLQNPNNETFADWAWFVLDLWNGLMAAARYPLISPGGLSDRVRLDRLVVVPTLALPLRGGLPSNNPDNSDKTVDLAWGFSAEADSSVSDYWAVKPHQGSPLQNPPPFLADLALIHELHHARYHIDSYGFDVHASQIRVQVDGKPMAGGLLPERFVRYQKYPGMMGGDYSTIDEYVAGVWQRVAGKRARGGNTNSPSVIGEWLKTDLPRRTAWRFLLPDGTPASGARVWIWRAQPDPSAWYGKRFEGDPDLRLRLDADGRVAFDGTPFPKEIRHTFGEANTVLLFLVRTPQGDFVHFQEISDLNLAYWQGRREYAEFEVRLVPPPGFSQ
ncbi:MAG: hypothetical protein LDL56_07715 [Armatimonadetes bacterium]|nr:hypothetical protein [Armatimonadota bacterium]MCA1997099.1 hypothetical protein [Armatimonadota bacterium]